MSSYCVFILYTLHIIYLIMYLFPFVMIFSMFIIYELKIKEGNRSTEWFRLDKTLKVTKSYHKPNTAIKPCP